MDLLKFISNKKILRKVNFIVKLCYKDKDQFCLYKNVVLENFLINAVKSKSEKVGVKHKRIKS